MKYWRGYLVAAIFVACTWGLEKFAESHSALVDMFYPYVTRMAQNFLSEWSAGIETCFWQILLLAFAVLVLASIVLMIIFKWNPIQWFGWVVAVASIGILLNTGIYELNKYSGSLAEDIRLQETDYTLSELENAAALYRDEANKLADQIAREENGDPVIPAFDVLTEQAAEGFDVLTYERFDSVFAGSVAPVKELSWADLVTARKITGGMVGLTGEAAINPQVPAVCQPFVICELMCRRKCIAVDADAMFGAFLACTENSAPEFRYSGYLMAYKACENALQAVYDSTGNDAVIRLKSYVNENLRHDLQLYEEFFGTEAADSDSEFTRLLASWHIQKYVLPLMQEEELLFDPLDETQVDLSGIVNGPQATVPEETEGEE